MAYTGVLRNQNNTPFPYGELRDSSSLDASALFQHVQESVTKGVSVDCALGTLLSGVERDDSLVKVLVERVVLDDLAKPTSLIELLFKNSPKEAVQLIEQFSDNMSVVELHEHFPPDEREILLQTHNHRVRFANRMLKECDPAFGICWLNDGAELGTSKLRTILSLVERDLTKGVVETLFDGVDPEVIVKTLSGQHLLPKQDGKGWSISISEFVRLHQSVFREYVANKMPEKVLEHVFFPDGSRVADAGPFVVRVPNASMFTLVTFGDGTVPSELYFAHGFKRFLESQHPQVGETLFNAYPVLRERMDLVGYTCSEE